MKFTLIALASSVLTISIASVALAGTGTCTAKDGAIIDGGKCCTAFGATGCTCDESGASVNGVVTCTHIKINEGDTRTIDKLVQPKTPKLTAPTSQPGTKQPTTGIKK